MKVSETLEKSYMTRDVEGNIPSPGVHEWIQFYLGDTGGDPEAQEAELKLALLRFAHRFPDVGCCWDTLGNITDGESTVLHKVMLYFEQPKKEWLIVMDDAIAIGMDIVGKYLPLSPDHCGCIILTSYNDKLLNDTEKLLVQSYKVVSLDIQSKYCCWRWARKWVQAQ